MHRNSIPVEAGVSGGRLRRTSATERMAWVRRFQQSGQTPRNFASKHGLVLSTLQRWRRHPKVNDPAPRLHELQIAPTIADPTIAAPSAPWDAEMTLPSGIQIKLRGELARSLVTAALNSGS